MAMGVMPQVGAFGEMADSAQTRLSGLLAEMQALMQILPANAPGRVLTAASPRDGRADVVAISEEDAIESGFDNMPL